MRLQELLSASAGRVGHKTAIVGDNVRYSYAELDRKSDRLAAALVARGVRPGDRVVVFMDNTAEAVVAIFSVVKAGGVFVPVEPAAAAEKLAVVLDSVRAVGVVTQARLASAAAAAMRKASTVRLVVLVGGDRVSVSESCLSFEDVVDRVGPVSAVQPTGADKDPVMLLCAGAGAEPVVLTHDQIVGTVLAASAAFEAGDSIVVRAAPVSFAAGFYRLLAAVRAGATLVVKAGSQVAQSVGESDGDGYSGESARAR